MRNMKAFDLLSGQQLDEWWNDLTQADSISRRLRARVTRGGLVGLAVARVDMAGGRCALVTHRVSRLATTGIGGAQEFSASIDPACHTAPWK